MRRAVVMVLTAALGVLGLAVGLSSAQGPTPAVTVAATPTTVRFEPDQALSGPTRVLLRNDSASEPADTSLVALRAGRTVDDLRAALASTTRGPTGLKDAVTFEAGTTLLPSQTYVSTIALRPGATYAAISFAENIAESTVATLAVGAQPGGGSRPTPDARVDLVDYRYRMPATLPRRGTIRFRNLGRRLHIAVAIPLRRGVNTRTVVRRLRRADDPTAVARFVRANDVFEPLGIVSGGTVSDVEVDFRRPGQWVFACFVSDGGPGNRPHNRLGMVRGFRVR
jgi:hypothetical protein